MKNKLMILFIALAASIMINTVYSGQSEFINGCITELVQKQAEFEISMRMHPSAELRSPCSPDQRKSYLFARVIARYGIDAVGNVLVQKSIEDMTIEKIIESVLFCKDFKLPVASFFSPLIHLAARYNNVPVLKLLLKTGDSVNLGVLFPTSYYTDTAGCWCFISDINYNFCGIMPSQEICVFPHYHCGYTPLDIAVVGRAKEAVSFLLQQSGIHFDNKIIMLALHSFPYSESQNNMEIACDIFQMLLKSMSDFDIHYDTLSALLWLEKHKLSILKKYLNAKDAIQLIEELLNRPRQTNCIVT